MTLWLQLLLGAMTWQAPPPVLLEIAAEELDIVLHPRVELCAWYPTDPAQGPCANALDSRRFER